MTTGQDQGYGIHIQHGRQIGKNGITRVTLQDLAQKRDTLTTILGDEDSAKAIATNINGKNYTVIQCLHDDGEGGQYRSWIHWDSIDGVHHHDFSFETIAFYYPVDEPVWMRG